MGTKEFIKKYRLDKCKDFPYNKFLEDFKREFLEMMEAVNGYDNMRDCRFCINSMRNLWDNINSESYQPLPDFLWRIFYRDTVCIEREKVRGFDQKAINHKREIENGYEKVK